MFVFYPKIIAIAIAFPVDIPKVDVATHCVFPEPSVVVRAKFAALLLLLAML